MTKSCLDKTNVRPDSVDDGKERGFCGHVDAHAEVGFLAVHGNQECLCCGILMFRRPCAIRL